MTPGANRPGYEDVLQAVERVRSNPICKVQVLGESVEGRAIPCLLLTDPPVPDDDKQCVLVVAGQHGTEESGRAIALELISFLASGGPEPSEILKRQVIAVIPCANPDGSVHETHRNAEEVDIAHTFAIDAPAAIGPSMDGIGWRSAVLKVVGRHLPLVDNYPQLSGRGELVQRAEMAQ